MTEPVEIPRISSVKIDENSKQEPGIKIHLYEGADENEIARIRDLALRTYDEMRAAVRG